MNTIVIIIMIICATVIALVALICDYFSEKKSGSTNAECRLSKKVVKLHRNYIAGILGFAIIMLLTAKFGGPNNAIFEYLSFGSTITSLVLSILAIFVTVQSSSDLYKQFARIDNATDTINSVSEQIEGTLSEIQKVEKDLSKVSQNISSQMENIVERIDEKIRTHIKASEDNLTKIFNAQRNNNDPVNNNIDTQTEIQEQYIQNFIQITSANGLLILYACALSKEKQKIFEISELFKGNEEYTYGFMIASISAGLVIFTRDASNNQITVRQIVFRKDELYDEIKAIIKQKKLGTFYVNKVNDINSYFEVEPLNVTVK
jgi:hypothetical protein